MLGNNQIGFNIWHLPSITFLLTCVSSTPGSVHWALSWLLDKINRIAGQKREVKLKSSCVCLYVDLPPWISRHGAGPSLHWKGYRMPTARATRITLKDFALVLLIGGKGSPLFLPHKRRGRGAEGLQGPPRQEGQSCENLQRAPIRFPPKDLTSPHVL